MVSNILGHPVYSFIQNQIIKALFGISYITRGPTTATTLPNKLKVIKYKIT